MEKTIKFKPRGVCAYSINITTEDNIIKKVDFAGGCNGNSQGISLLVEGSDIEDIIKRLKGIKCSGRSTSCPDQLAIALENAKNSN